MQRRSRFCPTALTVFVLAPFLCLGALASPAASGGLALPSGVDPGIATLVSTVSPDSLRATVITLQGFFTRHTNSDTVSTTVGIGAARRWVFDRFTAISAANGGNLQVAYQSFTATLSGVTREHRNVVATLPGTDPSAADRVFVIGGHLDSRNENANDVTGFAAGANDDASGVAAVIECARVLAGSSFEATIQFVAFTGEEQGLVGSTSLASTSLAEGMNVEAMLNNDIVGSVFYGEAGVGDSLAFDSTHVRMYSVGPEGSLSRQASRLFKLCGEAYEPAMEVNLVPLQDRPGRGGDHISYNNSGYTAIRVVDVFDNMLHQHAAGDTFQVMNFPYAARNVRLNLGTLGNLARAPRPVPGVAASDIGDSTGFVVTWQPNAEADLAGYRVTTRLPGVLDYDAAVDLGDVLTHTIAVASNDSVFIGVAAYDSAGHLGLATEVLAVLSSVPLAPLGIDATPDNIKITVAWNESPELDLAGYNVYRALTENGAYTQLNGALLSSPQYVDASVVDEQFYFYKATAVDLASNESPLSGHARGRLVSLTKGLLLFDETATPGGQPHLPTEAQADAFYASALQDFPHDVFEYDSVGAGGLTLSDIGAYSKVIWVSDDRNSVLQGIPSVHKHLADHVDVLSDYLDLGGQVLVMGWQEVGGFESEYPITFGPGDFLYDYFRVESVSMPQTGQHFWGATGSLAYPSVVVDTTKTRPQWVGKLPFIEYFTAAGPGAETVYAYRAASPDSAFNGAPVGVRYSGVPFRTQFFAFPLYHLRTADARALVGAAMGFFAPPTTSVPQVGNASATPMRLELGSAPNPAPRGSTVVTYSISREAAVELVIYSPSGARVRVLEAGKRAAGRHRVVWDGRDGSGDEVASGVYLYRLEAGGVTKNKKLVVMR